MFPVICQIGSITVYSYGLMLAIAVLVCSYLSSREAKKLGIAKEVIYDFVFWVVIGGVIGARLFYVILNMSYFWENPREIIMVQNGGLAWQGGLLLGSLSAAIFIRRRKLSFPLMADLSAPYLALGQSIGRVGCLLNGCCFGKEATWGLYFPVHHAILHPTQIYMSLAGAVNFLILIYLKTRLKVKGHLFVIYLLIEAMSRFVIEFFRADHEILAGGLSVFQYVCIIIFGAALYANSILIRRAR